MVFKPIADRTRWEGLITALWLLIVDALLFTWVLRRPTDSLRFVLILLLAVSLPALIHVLYRTWAAWTLEYWVDRNAVYIRWANVRKIVPLTAIRRIIEEGVEESGRPRWYHWPMPHVRQTQTDELPKIMLCATQPLHDCLLLDTGQIVFAISPQWRKRFIDHIQESYRLGPATNLSVSEEQTTWAPRVISENQIGVVLLIVGFIGVLALFGRLMMQYPSLPEMLPVRYTSAGVPEVVREKGALFILPAVALLTWVANGLWGVWMVFNKQSTGAYMLWGGAIVVQVFSFLALNSLLP